MKYHSSYKSMRIIIVLAFMLTGGNSMAVTNSSTLRANLMNRCTILPVNNRNFDSALEQTEKQEEPIFLAVEKMPEFPNGVDALKKFIKRNLITPKVHPKLTGKVITSFVVNKDGSIQDVVIIESLRSDYDYEAIRVVQLMPKWKPGQQSGRNLRVKYIMPVDFR